MLPDPAGRVALVTGGGSGIGRALALALAESGGTTIIVGRRQDALEETRALAAAPDRILPVPADLTDRADRERLTGRVTDEFGRLDLLINNAGRVACGPVSQLDDESVRQMTDLNIVAPLALTRDCLRLLRRGRSPRVVMIGSMFGDIAFPFFAAYSATKFGLRGLAEGLRRELRGDGIAVTYAAPRATRTPAADSFADLVGPLGMQLDEPDAVARRILRAVGDGRRSVYPAGPERLFLLLQRLAPSLIDTAIVRQTAGLLRAANAEGGGD